jgi:uncharacterized protein YoxC
MVTVTLDQNMLYIIIAVLVVVIILLAVFLARRRSRDGPSNVNQYLADEAKLKKVHIVEKQTGFQNDIPIYMRRPEDDLKDITKSTSDLLHKTIYHNRKIEDKSEYLGSLDKEINLKKQVANIQKKYLELTSPVKPKKEK